MLYGLGSKRDLLERFRTTMLQDCIHVVINGFFPGISVKSVSFKNVKRNNIISPANPYPHVNEDAISYSGAFSFCFYCNSFHTSRIAQCLRSCVWTQRVLALNPHPWISYLVTDNILNIREMLALFTTLNTNSTSLKDRIIMGDFNFIMLLCHFSALKIIKI